MPLRPDKKELVLWLFAAAVAAIAWMLPRIPQPLQYHQFADRHACFGMTGCFDIASNALFALSGLAGLHFLSGETGRHAFIDKREALPYRLFFVAAILVAIGSGYYHLAPDNSGLVWDRAAISLALMSLFAAIICERVESRVNLMGQTVLGKTEAHPTYNRRGQNHHKRDQRRELQENRTPD